MVICSIIVVNFAHRYFVKWLSNGLNRQSLLEVDQGTPNLMGVWNKLMGR